MARIKIVFECASGINIREYTAFLLSKLKLNILFSLSLEMESEGWIGCSMRRHGRASGAYVGLWDVVLLLNDVRDHVLKPSADAKLQEVNLLAQSYVPGNWICSAVVAPE